MITVSISLLAFSALASCVTSSSGTTTVHALQSPCNSDNLLRSFVAPSTSSAASSYCSTYIRPTVTASTVVTQTVYASSSSTGFSVASTYPPSRVSSACSCILTAVPSVTTVYTVTNTLPPPPTCTASSPIIQNGGFESPSPGMLDPWIVDNVYPNDGNTSYGVINQGAGASGHAFWVIDSHDGNYVEVDLEQGLQICKGQKYTLTAKYFMPEANGNQTFINFVVFDGRPDLGGISVGKIYSGDVPQPPMSFKTFTGTFSINTDNGLLRIAFVAMSDVYQRFAVDDISIKLA